MLVNRLTDFNLNAIFKGSKILENDENKDS